jgi:hypothetical protein
MEFPWNVIAIPSSSEFHRYVDISMKIYNISMKHWARGNRNDVSWKFHKQTLECYYQDEFKEVFAMQSTYPNNQNIRTLWIQSFQWRTMMISSGIGRYCGPTQNTIPSSIAPQRTICSVFWNQVIMCLFLMLFCDVIFEPHNFNWFLWRIALCIALMYELYNDAEQNV